jgi:hypothetical protein
MIIFISLMQWKCFVLYNWNHKNCLTHSLVVTCNHNFIFIFTVFWHHPFVFFFKTLEGTEIKIQSVNIYIFLHNCIAK